jgi:hypothetical protein
MAAVSSTTSPEIQVLPDLGDWEAQDPMAVMVNYRQMEEPVAPEEMEVFPSRRVGAERLEFSTTLSSLPTPYSMGTVLAMALMVHRQAQVVGEERVVMPPQSTAERVAREEAAARVAMEQTGDTGEQSVYSWGVYL